MKRVLTLLSLLCLVLPFYGQTPAFPGAEGGGMYTTGGRGGKVIYVTSLEDTNTQGTFRWAVSQSGVRTVVFKVSGIISLKSKLNITNGDLTIAGQTAPGDGICIRDYEVVVDADNVIIRFLRFRLGDRISTHEPDAFWGRYHKNIIIDHCSMSWSIDECSSFYSNESFTMQWSLIAESLNHSIHEKGDHGYGGIWGGKNTTFHHNLLAHHNSRNPRFNGWKRSGLSYSATFDEERVDYRNNVIYNWGDNSAYGGESDGKYNMVGNYYKAGPGTASSKKNRILQVSIEKSPIEGVQAFGTFYLADNYVYGYPAVTENNWTGVIYDSGVDKTLCVASKPFDFTANPVTMHAAEKAFEKVLSYAGCSLSKDAVDIRITNEVRNGTATNKGSYSNRAGLIDTQSDVGGWPEYNSTTAPVDSDNDGIPDGWLEANFPGKKANDLNESGYTYLEVYLNSLVDNMTKNQLADRITTGTQSIMKNDRDVTVYFDAASKEIKVSANETIYRVDIYTVHAKLVKSFTGGSKGQTMIQKGINLPSGIYIVRLNLEKSKIVTKKIIGL